MLFAHGDMQSDARYRANAVNECKQVRGDTRAIDVRPHGLVVSGQGRSVYIMRVHRKGADRGALLVCARTLLALI